jgi:zinc transport system permease protein
LTIPPFIVEKHAKSLVQMMVGSSLLGALFTVIGLWLSYRYDLTSGAAIIMVAGIAFLLSLLLERTGILARTKNQSATSESGETEAI